MYITKAEMENHLRACAKSGSLHESVLKSYQAGTLTIEGCNLEVKQ